MRVLYLQQIINLDHILIRAFDLVRAWKYSKEAVIKVEFTLEQAMKTQTGIRGIAVLFKLGGR